LVRGKSRFSTQTRKNPEMTVPISFLSVKSRFSTQTRKNPEMTVPISHYLKCTPGTRK
jgi:hypothetical protein